MTSFVALYSLAFPIPHSARLCVSHRSNLIGVHRQSPVAPEGDPVGEVRMPVRTAPEEARTAWYGGREHGERRIAGTSGRSRKRSDEGGCGKEQRDGKGSWTRSGQTMRAEIGTIERKTPRGNGGKFDKGGCGGAGIRAKR